MKKINLILSRSRPRDIQGSVQGRCWCSHPALWAVLPQAGSAGADTLAVCALGGQGTATEQGHPCQPCSSCSRERDGQGKASAVVSARGRRERGSSGSRENSDILSLVRNQVMSAQKTNCTGNSSRMCGEGGGEGSP